MKTGMAMLIACALIGGMPTSSSAQFRQRARTIVDASHSDNGGWLGITIEDLTPEIRKGLKTSTREGVVVLSVQENSPADKAGLRKNDVIVAVNGHAVNDRWDLLKTIRSEEPGTSVSLKIVRDNADKELTAELDEAQDHEVRVFPMLGTITHPFYMVSESVTQGLRMMELNEQLGEYFGAPDGKGVLVEEVRHNSPAAKAGFRAGDVIIRVGNDPIEDIMDVRNALRHFESGDSARFGILRKGSSLTLVLRLGDRDSGGFDFRSEGWNPSEFQGHMREFGERMRQFGKDLQLRMKGLGDRIRANLLRMEI